ncbi:TetR family transcriptional regulator [Nonomuraea sp. NPDC026600]|uniref:TetR/AcrR family transcriptional regulator n=1 Tax=Nonomuraea sp. NPDC026600 TaxID=3155363 RepID=UPI0033C141C9
MSTPHAAPERVRRRPRAETRALVLEAAMRAFGETGYAQTSLEQVAAMAGLSRGAVYSNFAGKDELFLELLRETIAQRIRQIARAMAPAPTRAAQTRQAGEVMVGELREHPERHLLFIEFWMRAVRDPDIRQQFRLHRQETRDVLAAALREQATRWGVALPMPAPELAIGLMSLFNGFGLEHLVDPDAATPELFDKLLSALLSPAKQS